MRRADTVGRGPSTWMIVLLFAVALIGYLIGHHRSHAASRVKRRTISTSNVLLSYPQSWQVAAAAPTIPGLSLIRPVVLAPDGHVTRAGLIAGQLPASEASLLPKQFLTAMRSLPDTEVVDLAKTQSYRYARLSIKGFDRTLSLFTIPTPGGNSTALACYASASFSAEMQTCEQIVARLAVVKQSQSPSHDLAPEPGYARKLRASIGALDGQRVALRSEMSPGAPAPTVQRLATRLAAAFANTADSLSRLKPSPVTGQQQARLSQSISRARDAYAELAAAAAGASPSRAAAARIQVYEAETAINTVLENFALLGYRT
jgi:hypothetical protein